MSELMEQLQVAREVNWAMDTACINHGVNILQCDVHMGEILLFCTLIALHACQYSLG